MRYMPCFLIIFLKSTTSISRSIYKITCAKFRRIEDTIIAENQQWWDKFFVQQYSKYKISPRGLRNTKTCSFLCADLTHEWANISEFCTQKWIEIVAKQRDIQYQSLLSKITDLISSLQIQTPSLPISWLKKLKLNTKFQEDTLLGTKLHKIRRDFDYNTDRVFCWKKRCFSNPNVSNSNDASLGMVGPTPLMECVPRPTIGPYPNTIRPLMNNHVHHLLFTRSKARLAQTGDNILTPPSFC